MSTVESNVIKPDLSKKDFASDQMVRWCPGCGDFMILNTMQKAFAELQLPTEQIVCVSGIGCSSRLPYYLATYGIHSIHGRAAATATGVKISRPDLSVWVVTGDGDCMAIGGNHFIHAVRKNIDMNIIIFNNKIYGMTKGQSSPTTPEGTKTKTTPTGTFERPFNIGEVTIGAHGTFFARVPDNNPKLLQSVLVEAEKHRGTSVVEVLQNCVVFTDGIHEQITGKETAPESQVVLEHGKPLVYGKEKNKGLRANGFSFERVKLENNNGKDNTEPLVHDAHTDNPELHLALTRLQLPENPIAMGVIRNVEAPTFDEQTHKSIEKAQKDSQFKDVSDLFKNSGNTWEIN